MASRSAKMYDATPTLKRGDDGKMRVARAASSKSTGGLDMDARQANERREMMVHHVQERMDLHHRHEMEHAGQKGDKAALNRRHEEELKGLHRAHESAQKAMNARHEKGDPSGGRDGKQAGTEAPRVKADEAA